MRWKMHGRDHEIVIYCARRLAQRADEELAVSEQLASDLQRRRYTHRASVLLRMLAFDQWPPLGEPVQEPKEAPPSWSDC